MALSITPEELQLYTDFDSVKERSVEKLQFDILEAETHIQEQLALPLSEYMPIPGKLRLALLKVAQFFALVNSDESISKGFKSEKIGDYSYTLGDGSAMNFPDVSSLLSEFAPIIEPIEKNMLFRMRPL